MSLADLLGKSGFGKLEIIWKFEGRSVGIGTEVKNYENVEEREC